MFSQEVVANNRDFGASLQLCLQSFLPQLWKIALKGHGDQIVQALLGTGISDGSDVSELCMGALYNLSWDPDTSFMLIERFAIRGIVFVMKEANRMSVDDLCVATLHNLSNEFSRAGKLYAAEGALDELITMTEQDKPRVPLRCPRFVCSLPNKKTYQPWSGEGSSLHLWQ